MKKGIKNTQIKPLEPYHQEVTTEEYTMHNVLSGFCNLKPEEKQLVEGAIEQLKLNPQMEKDYINRFKNY